MKKIVILVLSCFFVFTNCSVNNDSETPQNYRKIWHLINASGGIAGVNENFELETIIWSFDEPTLKLTVANNNQDDTIQDGLDSGIYDYSIISTNGESYLVINGNESGELTFFQTNMVINENIKSTGTGADGFMYSFQVEVILVE